MNVQNGSTLTAKSIDVATVNVIGNGSTITSLASTTAAIYSLTISADDLNIGVGAKIDVSGKGYLGGYSGANKVITTSYAYGRTYLNNLSSCYQCAGGHAGYGSSDGNGTYGNFAQPITLGSGGSGYFSNAWFPGGNGGGAVHLIVTNKIQLAGSILADGQMGTRAISPFAGTDGGGAGGSIWIETAVLEKVVGTSPIISADGKGVTFVNNVTADGQSLGGGGGRVAIYYNSLAGTAFTTVAELAGITHAFGGVTTGSTHTGGAGTVYLYSLLDSFNYLVIDNGVNIQDSSATLVNQYNGNVLLTAPITIAALDVVGNAKAKKSSGYTLDVLDLYIGATSSLYVPNTELPDFVSVCDPIGSCTNLIGY